MAVILVTNLIPVYGVAALGWNAGQILILYWIENVILGVLTVPRLVAAGRGGGGCFLPAFFIVHYGMFCAGHLVFALHMVSEFSQGRYGLGEAMAEPGFQLAIAGIFGLNLLAQLRDWWWPGKWRDADPKDEMFKPYGRIIVLHLTVLFGAWLVLITRAPVGAILLLCGLKALLELGGLTLKDALFRKPA